MKKGDIVKIYEDPVTEYFPEGKAKLIKKIGETCSAEYWIVSFITKPKISYYRWKKKKVEK